MMHLHGLMLTALLALVLPGCKTERPAPGGKRVDPPRTVGRRHAPRPRLATPATPKFPIATKAQRAYDLGRAAALDKIVGALKARFEELAGFATRGARDEAFRMQWSTAREKYVKRVGALRAAVLAVDPLRKHSWATPVASWLIDLLSVGMPDAVRESWRQSPSGALVSKKQDFRLIWNRLRHYVEKLQKKRGKRPSKDIK